MHLASASERIGIRSSWERLSFSGSAGIKISYKKSDDD
jgi:hypothetical protein